MKQDQHYGFYTDELDRLDMDDEAFHTVQYLVSSPVFKNALSYVGHQYPHEVVHGAYSEINNNYFIYIPKNTDKNYRNKYSTKQMNGLLNKSFSKLLFNTLLRITDDERFDLGGFDKVRNELKRVDISDITNYYNTIVW